VNHLGIQVDAAAELTAMSTQLTRADRSKIQYVLRSPAGPRQRRLLRSNSEIRHLVSSMSVSNAMSMRGRVPRVIPLAISLLTQLNFPTESLPNTSWDEFAAPESLHLDFVITACDNAAGEMCPTGSRSQSCFLS